MKKFAAVLGAMFLTGWGSTALADASCGDPSQDGNTWNMVCADDGKGDDQYQCNYRLNVTNASGVSNQVNASGSVSQGQQGVIIWSGIQQDGSDIVSISVVSGECSAK